MERLSRRHFSRLVAASPLLARAAVEMPTRRLGKIDFQAGILGWGAQHIGRPPAEQSTVDRIVAEGIDNGLNFIDTAPNYGISEQLLGPALKGRRHKIFLVSKIETRTRAEAFEQVRESLRRLQTDYIDCVHFHNIGRDDRWPDLVQVLSEDGALGALVEAKKQGMIRHIGCTTHTFPERTLRAFNTGHIDLIMCVLNFVDRHIYALEEKLLPEARRRNIAVVAMKVLGGPVKGAGARLGSLDDYQAALRYAWTLPEVATSAIGVRTPEELRQALAAARAFKPLDASEAKVLAERGKLLAAQWGPTRGPVA